MPPAPRGPRCRPCRPGPAGRRADRRFRAGSRSAPPCGPGSGPAGPPGPRCCRRRRSPRRPRCVSARSDQPFDSPSGTGPDRCRGAGDDIRCRTIAAAAATFSDSAPERIGIVTLRWQRSTTSGGSPSRSEPRQTVKGARRLPRRLAPVREQRQRAAPECRRRSRAPAAPRTPSPCLRGRPWERTGRRSRGPRTTVPSTKRVGGADHGADVGRVADPVQIDADRALDLLRPALAPGGDHPRPRAKARLLGEQLGLDLEPADPRPGGAEQQQRLGAGGDPRLQQVLALGQEQPLALAAAAVAQAADQLQLLVVGACDHYVSSVLVYSKRKGGSSGSARETEDLGSARQPLPPGPARRIAGTPRGRGPRCRRASCGSPRHPPRAGRASAASSSSPRAWRRR